jgi:putative CocE/NonD family hydrolase
MTDDRLASRQLPVAPVSVERVRMRDGVTLLADVYRPATGGPYPVLLQRQAYGRRIGCTICYAHPSWYAAQGYIVVVQDIRGRGDSGGDFNVGENEADDGAQTIGWASGLAGSTGAVGMYGFSYQGYAQFLAAGADAPELSALKALAPAMAPWHARETWATENGALRLRGALGWATQIAGETARRAGDADAFAQLLAESATLNTRAPCQARPDYMHLLRRYSHYERWLETPADDPYWSTISPATYVESIARRNLPIMMLGGWYDTHLASTLAAYDALRNSGCEEIYLRIGPWQHFPWDRRVAGRDFGSAAAASMDQVHIRFFDRYLKGSVDAFEEPKVRLFDLGARDWLDFDDLPQSPIRFALSGSGRSTIDASDGRLLTDGETAPVNVEFIVHDPWRPAPAVGGAFGAPSGPAERASADTRGDVATFTTDPLTSPLTLAGRVEARIAVSADRPSFDLCCVLSKVAADGQTMTLCDGYRHIRSANEDDTVIVPLKATCITLAPGESLRLSLSGAAFPAFPVNPGHGGDPTRSMSVEALITTLAIKVGGKEGAHLQASVVRTPAIKEQPIQLKGKDLL